ncbi:hypothetical protein Tco_1284753 [Tanacetum coccineum]
MNDGTPMCEHHDTNYIQSEGYQNRDSHDSYSHQSHHDPNDSEKSLTELNNDVKSDLEDFHSFMSSASSAVTYTSVYTDSEPGRVFWGADEEISDGDIPRVIHPASPDYVPGREHPPSPIEIPYVPEPKLWDGDDEPSGDDTDDDDADDDDEEPFEDEEDDEEEEEHLAPANSSAIPIVDPVPSAGDTEAFETDESAPTPRPSQIRIPFAQTRLRRARKTIRPEPPMSASMEARIAEHAAAPTPPLPVASSPLPLPSPLTTSPTDAGAPLGYRAAEMRMRAAAASPPSLLPPTSPRTDFPEAEMPPRKRACLTTPTPRYEIGESSAAGAARQPGPTPEVDTWDEIVEAMMEIAPTTLEGVDQRVTELDTNYEGRGPERFEIRFEEALMTEAYLGALVNSLFRDRPYHRHTALALDRELVYARITWTSSEERSAAIEAHVRTLEAQADAAAIGKKRDASQKPGTAINMPWFRSRAEEGQLPNQRECTYTDFLKCQPINFKGTEGVVGLTQWVEKMESVFLISSCAITSQDVAYAMPWTALKRMITDKYCPRGKIKKLESEYWNLKVRGTDLMTYN